MIVSTDKREFLTMQVPELLTKLTASSQPKFGIMTPQHMVEHLTWVTKSSLARNGQPEAEPTDSQKYFRKFISKGAIFKHRESDKAKEDLPKLKYESLQEAIEKIPDAVDRLYQTFEQKPDYKSYNPMMGEFDFDDHELFHYEHYKYHFYQFGLIEKYYEEEA
jgi:oxepin-CoA hydrolase/3-oxo-5,6-dehydrosuberyl-CoA semialdehyde dehydrogenase